MNCNLALSVYHHATTAPDALAVAENGNHLAYAQLARRAAGLAQLLTQVRPCHTGDGDRIRVGILASRSVDACIAVLGASWVGATYVPLGHNLPAERLISILSLCKLSAIVTDDQGAALLTEEVLQHAPSQVFVLAANQPKLPSFGARLPLLSCVTWLSPAQLDSAPITPPRAVESTDIAYIIFTSGTTGTPKGVMISAGSIRSYIKAMTELLGLTAVDRSLEVFELTFDPSGHNMFTTWEAGASLYILPARRVMSAVKFARDNELTVWTLAPSLAGMLRQIGALTVAALPTLRVAAFGGEQLPQGVVRAWRAAAPACTIYNLYGPTEATVACMSQLVTEATPMAPGRDVLAIGKALPGNEAAVLDGHHQPVPDNCLGELAIAGTQLALGYLDAPVMTQARFPTISEKRWYLTGDLAIRDIYGNFHCLGRADNQVKVLGHRVELEEVDAHLRIVTDVDVVGTVAWPIVEGCAKGLVAFISAVSVDDVEVICALKSRLPSFMVPSQILPLEQIPLSVNGKVDRNALRLLLEERAT